MRVLAAVAAVLISTSVVFADASRVIVAPFSEADAQQHPDWISRSLHQSLVDDVAAIPEVTVLNASKPADPSDAQYIVRGTIQRSGIGGSELRISGRIEEMPSGKTVGGFKASGLERELFALQDSIAAQIRSVFQPRQQQQFAQQPQQLGPQQAGQGQQPQQPAMMVQGAFEGSELQRALMDRDYVRRAAIRGSVPDYTMPTYGYQQPLYPYTIGLNGNYPYGYGGHGHSWGFPGYGWGGGWGGGNIIIIKRGDGHHGGGGGGGVAVPNTNGQAIRHVASWAGRPPSVFVNVPGGTTGR
ncbi:MAG: hypothetical protein ABIP55_11800 [Tepidisphaeraceae bacterium]